VVLRRPTRRQWRIGLAAIGLTALGVVAQRWGWVGSGGSGGLGGSEPAWIWVDADARDVRPRVFLAVRDFELGRVPSNATARVLGDQEYVLWINGSRAGSGRYRAHAPLDTFDVSPLLRLGANRVALELRSAVGSGAAILSIVDGAGQVLVATGAGWKVLPSSWRAGIAAGDLPKAPAAAVLGRSPLGRWGDPRPGPQRPLFGDVVAGQRPVRARRFRRPLEGGRWRMLPPGDEGRPKLGELVEFDFGRPVTGYLVLAVRNPERATLAGLLRFGFSPSDANGWPADAVAITADGRGHWYDVEPRRFRYVEVAGLDGVLSAAVLPIEATRLGALRPFGSDEGLLGIVTPPVRLPIEDAIWKRLDGRERAALEPERDRRLGGGKLRRAGAARSSGRTRELAARPRPERPAEPAAPAARATRRERRPPPASPPAAPAPGSPPAPPG
jgi:hypothetical protein